MRGKFITFEGGEGSGKSTQVNLLLESFKKAGITAIKTREPGGVESAENIRKLLVTGDTASINPITETLLNFAARSEHLEKLVLPSLQKGISIICDRFVDSTIAYQGYGHGLGGDFIRIFEKIICGNFKPDLTFLLDIDLEKGLERANIRGDKENRFEKMGKEFHSNLNRAFKDLAEKEPERFAIIDASLTIEEIAKKIRESINSRLGIKL